MTDVGQGYEPGNVVPGVTNSVDRPTGKFEFHNSGRTCLELKNEGDEPTHIEISNWPDDRLPPVVDPHTVKLIGPFPIIQFTEHIAVTYTPSPHIYPRSIDDDPSEEAEVLKRGTNRCPKGAQAWDQLQVTIPIRKLSQPETLALFPGEVESVRDARPTGATRDCVLKDGHHFVRFRDRWDDGREHCTGCMAIQEAR